MTDIHLIATSRVTEPDVRTARLGTRFGRMDLSSQLALLAVSRLEVSFDGLARDRIAICLGTGMGSLPTDWEFWQSRLEVGGASPMLFTYTLPSSPIGEIAIQFRLTGPNACFVGDERLAVAEGVAMLRRGEADACVCIGCSVVSEAVADLSGKPPQAGAYALFLQRGSPENGRRDGISRDLQGLVDSILQDEC